MGIPGGEKKKRRHFSLLLLLFFALLTGCVSYKPMPITQETVKLALAVPSNMDIRLQARSIKHPILKPISLDLSDGLSPDEAAIFAVIVNPSLRVARDSKGLAAAQILQAGILPNPRFSWSVETPVGGDTSGKVNAYGLGVDWSVASLVSRGPSIASARFHAASVDLGIAWKEWQVAEAAKLAVYRLLIAQKRCALARLAERAAMDALERLKKSVALRVETAPRLFSAQTVVEETRARVIEARSKVKAQQLELSKILGLPPWKRIAVQGQIPLVSKKSIPSVDVLNRDIEKNRLDLLALKCGYKSQEERLRSAIRAQFPKINLGFTSSRDTDGVKTLGTGISISIPLFDRNQGRIAVERATRKELFDEYASRLFESRADIARIIEGLQAILDQLETTKNSILVLKQIAKQYHKSAQQGNMSIIDYYDVLLRLYAKMSEKLSLEYRIANSAVALELASGRYIFTGSDMTVKVPAAASRLEDVK